MEDCEQLNSIEFEAGANNQIRLVRKKETVVDDPGEVPDWVVTTEEGLIALP
jgi:hypothetical protein